MRLKKAWMLATIMTLCGTMMTMSSCKKDDDPSVVPIPELTPEEQLKADTYERIKFLREDPALQELGIGRMFLFQEDDTYECATFYQADTNGDGKMDEDESVMMVSNGTWKPLGKVNCSLVNESFDALAVDYVIKSIVELPSTDILYEPAQEQYKDTLYIIPNPAGGDNFFFQSDLVTLWMLSNQEELSASTRWDLSDIWNAATEILKQVIKDVIPGVWEFWKWTKATFADSYDPVVLGMSYAVSANSMNQFANNTIRGRMGQKTGWIVMDFAGLDIEGSMRVNVYGDVLIQALIDNNRAMVNKGVLK